MSISEKLAAFLTAMNRRDTSAMQALLADEFFGYVAPEDEPSAPEATADILSAIVEAFPDFALEASTPAEENGQARAGVTVRGTFSGSLWAVPGDGRPHEFQATAVARPIADRIAVRWDGAQPIQVLRTLGLMPMPENAHLRPEHPVQAPEMLLKLAFNGNTLVEKQCAHLDAIKVTEPTVDVCERCVAAGTIWPALRMCLTCGAIGCCDMAVGHHAKAHAEANRHPLIRSIEPGEGWIWCYEDNAFLGSRHLKGG